MPKSKAEIGDCRRRCVRSKQARQLTAVVCTLSQLHYYSRCTTCHMPPSCSKGHKCCHLVPGIVTAIRVTTTTPWWEPQPHMEWFQQVKWPNGPRVKAVWAPPFMAEEDIQVIVVTSYRRYNMLIWGCKICVLQGYWALLLVILAYMGTSGSCTCNITMSPCCPWGEGGHLDLLWFLITQMCVCVRPCLSVPYFVYAIFPMVFRQWLSNSLVWWPWTTPLIG